jgi:hypothetical protein
VLFLSAGESKLVTYLLPVFPAVALVIAQEIVAFGRSRTGRSIHIVTLAVLPILTVIAMHLELRAPIGFTWIIPTAAMAIVLALARRAASARSMETGIALDAVMALVTFVAVMSSALPRAAEYLTSRDLAAALNAAPHLPPHLAVLDERIGSVIFYLSPNLRAEATAERIQSTSLPAAIERAQVGPPDALLAVRDNQLQRVTRLFAQPPVPAVRAGTFSLFRADQVRAAVQTSAR